MSLLTVRVSLAIYMTLIISKKNFGTLFLLSENASYLETMNFSFPDYEEKSEFPTENGMWNDDEGEVSTLFHF